MPLLDGKAIAADIRAQVSKRAGQYRHDGNTPLLSIVTATDDPGSQWYVDSIRKTAKTCYIETRLRALLPTATTDELAACLRAEAEDSAVHGIILQTPLPAGVDIDALLPLIPLQKDIDGANPLSAGNLAFGLSAFPPATAEAVMALLQRHNVEIAGKRAVVIGRSRIVGKPVAQLLLQADATVTICHSKSANLADLTVQADIVVAAVGRPNLIEPSWIKPEAVVIDVGTNVNDASELIGDVDPRVAEHANLTPVPGGVGPVTTALILQHVVDAVNQQK
jgi:methylenetetrahydrofolate dehydrogenase (NADP+) / methenyltetrahydrofolate cyclohydrolase